jgi:hypothetical protein
MAYACGHHEQTRPAASTCRSALSLAKSRSPARVHSAASRGTDRHVARRRWARSKHQLRRIVPSGAETSQGLRVTGRGNWRSRNAGQYPHSSASAVAAQGFVRTTLSRRVALRVSGRDYLSPANFHKDQRPHGNGRGGQAHITQMKMS